LHNKINKNNSCNELHPKYIYSLFVIEMSKRAILFRGIPAYECSKLRKFLNSYLNGFCDVQKIVIHTKPDKDVCSGTVCIPVDETLKNEITYRLYSYCV
jgi:hypothetical protein